MLCSAGRCMVICYFVVGIARCGGSLQPAPIGRMAHKAVRFVTIRLFVTLLQGDVLLWHKENGLETLDAVNYIELLEGEVSRLSTAITSSAAAATTIPNSSCHLWRSSSRSRPSRRHFQMQQQQQQCKKMAGSYLSLFPGSMHYSR